MKKLKHLPDLNVFIIPHKEQRYDTAGDYYENEFETWDVTISEMQNPDYEFLVLAHELIEWYLTQKRGIAEFDITKFDTILVDDCYRSDPGLSPKAPYHKEHMFSERIEKILAKELGVNWHSYCNSFKKLKWNRTPTKNRL
jgi:hypothetical protein